MDARMHDAAELLRRLGELCGRLRDADLAEDELFRRALELARQALDFDVGVLYRVDHAIEGHLILRVAMTLDPEGRRGDLAPGTRISLDLADPASAFRNEIQAFLTRGVSAGNVPGGGCDVAGFIDIAEVSGEAYLFGVDHVGPESGIKDYETGFFEILCRLLGQAILKEHYRRLAVHDTLTGLYNSRKIREELEVAQRRFQRNPDKPLAVALGDVDHFKRVNDTWGHVQGDAVLEGVGAVLASSIRARLDLAGRYGGEEFLLIMEDTTLAHAMAFVERLRHAVEVHPFPRLSPEGRPVAGETIPVTMSFGVAALEGPAEAGAPSLLVRADRALYEAKRAGRNRALAG